MSNSAYRLLGKGEPPDMIGRVVCPTCFAEFLADSRLLMLADPAKTKEQGRRVYIVICPECDTRTTMVPTMTVHKANEILDNMAKMVTLESVAAGGLSTFARFPESCDFER